MKNRMKLETFNCLSHGLGALVGLGILVFICLHSQNLGPRLFVGQIIYLSSFIFLFFASSLYHGVLIKKKETALRILDHSAIFIFIAGSYTPLVLAILDFGPRIIFLSLIWGLALGGLAFKVITRGKFDKFSRLSLGLYIAMGWISVFLIPKMVRTLGLKFILGILAGGLLYTLGTYFYKKKEWTYHHLIWHFFVLGGALVHMVFLVFGLAIESRGMI